MVVDWRLANYRVNVRRGTASPRSRCAASIRTSQSSGTIAAPSIAAARRSRNLDSGDVRKAQRVSGDVSAEETTPQSTRQAFSPQSTDKSPIVNRQSTTIQKSKSDN